MDKSVSPAEAFGLVLARLRKDRGLSQEAFAFQCGFDRSFVARLETGQRKPGLASIFRLANGLGLSASQLIAELEREINADTEN